MPNFIFAVLKIEFALLNYSSDWKSYFGVTSFMQIYKIIK